MPDLEKESTGAFNHIGKAEDGAADDRPAAKLDRTDVPEPPLSDQPG